MPITVHWDDPEQTITYMTFKGAPHVDTLFTAWREELAMQTSVDHPVYSLNDFTHVHPVLHGVSLRRLVDFIQHNQAPNLRMTVQFTPAPVVHHSLHVIAALMPHRVHIVKTLADARRVIEADKATYRKQAG